MKVFRFLILQFIPIPERSVFPDCLEVVVSRLVKLLPMRRYSVDIYFIFSVSSGILCSDQKQAPSI